VEEAVHPPRLIRFETFEVDLPGEELRKDGLKLKLTGQPFQVLGILLERPGEVVTREALQQRLWPDTFVDVDHNLNTAINKIREVLGDSADSPRFIETLPRRGYRFVAPVEKNLQAPGAGVSERHIEKFIGREIWIAVGVTLLILLCGIGIWRFSLKARESPLPSSEAASLTALPGFHAYPAFSPDGNQVAFVIEGPQNPGIYTTLVGGEKALQLTSNPGDSSPTWSPDGGQVAFTRYDGNSLSICVIPALGGTERKLYTLPYRPPSTMEWLNWSPTGKLLAFTESSRIQLFSIADSTTRPLTSPPDRRYDYGPVFSPDSSTVAFVRGSVAGVGADLFVVPARGGEAKRLTFDNSAIFGPSAWTPDSREIVFSSSRRGLHNLWRISVSGGTPSLVTGVVMASHPSISRKGDLAYLQQLSNDNIWQVRLKDEIHPQGPATAVISAKWQNSRPQFSPDGKRIVFEADRSGHSEIWTCSSDGSNCGQLTSLQGMAGGPRWSPDGRHIAFEFHAGEHTEIYVMEVPGGIPRLVHTLPDADNLAPSWSRDGQWIYFASDDASGRFDLWKVPVKGGFPVQVTKNGGIYATESADERFLYFSKLEVPGVWKIPLAGGDETRMLDQPAGWDSYGWTLARNGIYFLDQGPETTAEGVPQPGPKPNVVFFDFATGKRALISRLEKPAMTGLAVSPDGKSILFVQNEFSESSIMLLKNFR
jgi:Tol biopolymer transport system component/DNA-binding winged helix-turn-helix (wHTH) protein